MEIGLTKKELASVAGYTYRRLHDIDAGLPGNRKLFVKNENGKYDLALFVQRWVEYKISGDDNKDLSLEEAKAVHERVKIEKSQLEVARMRGELVDVNEVRRLWATVAATVTQNLIRLPNVIAPAVHGLDNVELIAGMIDKEIREALQNIAQTPIPGGMDDEDSEEPDEEE